MKILEKNKGLSNEVGYYIFDYPAEEEIKVRKYLENLKKQTNQNLKDMS